MSITRNKEWDGWSIGKRVAVGRIVLLSLRLRPCRGPLRERRSVTYHQSDCPIPPSLTGRIDASSCSCRGMERRPSSCGKEKCLLRKSMEISVSNRKAEKSEKRI